MADAPTEGAAAPVADACPARIVDQAEADRLYQEIMAAANEVNCEKGNEFEQQWRTKCRLILLLKHDSFQRYSSSDLLA